MTETGREKMGDSGSFDDDGDVTNVADRFSDEIIGYDVEDIVDVMIADDSFTSENDIDFEKIKNMYGDGWDSSDYVNNSSSNNNNHKKSGKGNDNDNICTRLGDRDRRWVLWVGLSMFAAFLFGTILGNTHHSSTRGDGHPPATMGNSELAQNGKGHPPSSMGNQDLLAQNLNGQLPPDSIDINGSNNESGNHIYYGDIPDSSSHQGPPSTTEEDKYEKRKRHFTTLVVEWSGAAAVATPDSPARRALDWMMDEDPFQLTMSDRTLDVQQRYIMAVFYYATLGEHWSSRRRLSNRKQRHRRHRRVLQDSSHDDVHNLNKNNGNEVKDSKPITDSNIEANFLTYLDVCNWNTFDGRTGAFCDQNGLIERLDFRDFGLGGTLPREFGFLTSLKSLNIEYNDVEGTLPTYYGLLVNLESMKFESNQITGKIPTELSNLKKLQKLDLDGNSFTGLLPVEIAGLQSIVKIEIGGSNLTGSIPTELSNLKESIQKLDLKDNNFSGNIPTELGSLTKLNYLDLENNELSGPIPVEMGTAKSLEMLYLNGNDFAGSLDAAFCDTNIAFFEFVADCRGTSPEVMCSCCTSCCNTNGSDCATVLEPLIPSPKTVTPTEKPVAPPTNAPTIPQTKPPTNPPTIPPTIDSSKLLQILTTVSDPSSLTSKHTEQFKAFMWMSRADPSPLNLDTTPYSIIVQKYIMALMYVSTNGSEWKNQNSFLTSANVCDWQGLTCNDDGNIVSLIIENNNLDGTLVSEIGALGPNLRELQLGMNNLRGKLPSELGKLSGLKTLDIFDNNDITGTIPAEMSSQFLTKIEKVQLVGTGISGSLDPLFCTFYLNGDGIRNVSADCFDPSIACSCCEVCCDAAGDNCQVVGG